MERIALEGALGLGRLGISSDVGQPQDLDVGGRCAHYAPQFGQLPDISGGEHDLLACHAS